MSIIVNINSGADFEPVSEGVHAAVLADIVDLGVVDTGYGPKEKIRLVWLTDEADEEGRTKYLFKRYTKSLHEKANLRKDFVKIVGRDLTAEELKQPDLNIEPLMLGRQNQLVVQHSEDASNGKVYANVIGFLKPVTKLAIPADFKRKEAKPAVGKKPSQSVKAAGGGRAVAAAIAAPASAPINDDDIPF